MSYIISKICRLTLVIFLLFFSALSYSQNDHHMFAHTVTIRKVPDSVVSKMKKQDDFRYANDPSYWQEQKPADNSGLGKLLVWLAQSGVMNWLLYLFLAALILFILYQVLSVNGFKLFTPGKRKAKPTETFTQEETENIEVLIASSIQQRKFREATRYLYLKTLRSLSANNLITIQAKATNHDYIYQMSKSAKSKDFGILTNMYEYVWYGEFQPDDYQFHIINDQFNQFISNI
ncbi:MAG: hypothetical protein ABI415_10570 [Flavitalea sp.]